MWACLFCGSHTTSARAASENYTAAFTALLEAEGLREIVENSSCGLWIALRTPKGTANIAFGFSEAPSNSSEVVNRGTRAAVTDVVPAGSITKVNHAAVQ